MNLSNKEYMLTNFSYVQKNLNHFKEYANLAHKRFEFSYGKKSSTDFYRYYNCVSLLVGSTHYYKLFKDVFKLIRKYSKSKKPLWFQCWLNFHYEKDLLKWHNHSEALYHGYISIDPKNTETVFKNYVIKNKVGNIYIGPSLNEHKVISKKPYKDNRITIAFDVVDEKTIKKLYNQYGDVDINTSFLPIY
tara:strand:- start:48 stop:617 length:570 start_codon:yes stop_codon:yes gene_type:complete